MKEEHPINRYSQESDRPRSVALDLSLERTNSCTVLARGQVANAGTASFDNIGQPKLPLREPPIFLVREGLVDQAGVKEELPKPVRGAGKMVSHGGPSDPWVNADKEDTRPSPQVVLQLPWLGS